MTDPLTSLSDALAERTHSAAGLLVSLCPGTRAQRSGLLWQEGVVVTAEQHLPDEAQFAVVLPGGTQVTANVAGRDPGTNLLVLKLPMTGPARPEAAAPVCGRVALALGSAEGAPTVRAGVVHRVGPGWDSMAGGRLDHYIQLDMNLGSREEGGPVLDAAGGLLGMSTLGPRRRAIVIPTETMARMVPQLLAGGRVAKGWLGLGLQPVGLPAALRERAGRESGLMVVSLSAGGPAEQAGVLPGDILLDVAGVAAPHPRSVSRALSGEQVGKPVPLRLLRGGAPVDLQATVAERPAA